MAHGHHHHHHVDPDAGDRRVAIAVAVNLGLTIVQFVGGLVAGSVALLADAVHNFSDALSLILAYGARKIARRPATSAMPFGHGKIETVAALINYFTLFLMGLWLVAEGIERLANPQPVAGWIVVALAGVALVVDGVTAALTFALSKDSANIRAAFLHNLADALGSVAVIVAGLLILLFGWNWADPVITLLIAGYILWMALGEIGGVIKALMLGAPEGTDPKDVEAALLEVPGVVDVHNQRLWQMNEGNAAFDAHLALSVENWADAMTVRDYASVMLAQKFGITHTTLAVEPVGSCETPATYGYDAAEAPHGHHDHDHDYADHDHADHGAHIQHQDEKPTAH